MKKLGFGLMRLPLTDKTDSKSIDIEALKKMADAFIENGFCYFDTAYVYHGGESERAFGEAVAKRHPRDSFKVATKMPVFSISTEEDLERVFNEQLERCAVDYFDYYLLHNLAGANYEKAEALHAFEFVERKKAEGRIKHWGFSAHDTADRIDLMLTRHPGAEFVQLQINYLDWDNIGIQSRLCYETAVKHGKKVIVMEPVKGGMLANLPEKAKELLLAGNPDMSAASWAIRYAASLDEVMMVLSGMSNDEQLEDNMSYMKEFKPLDESEKKTLESAVQSINEAVSIQCTGCAYCVDGCPMNIAIPDYFALYNTEKQEFGKGIASQRGYYRLISTRRGKASECIECGQCEAECPQHLKITELLKNVAETFEVKN